MIWIWIIPTAAVLLAALWVWCLKGEKCDLAPFDTALLAHRGLHNADRPENSLSAFRAAFERGYGAELDVHLTADGRLAVLHDRSLLRTVGTDADVTALTADELRAFSLRGSDEPIPFLEEVLALADGRVPLLIELKADGGNHAALCEVVCHCLQAYPGEVALESFDPRCLWWLRRHQPQIRRGQLSQNFHRCKDVHPLLRPLLTGMIANLLTRPHFIAYRHDHRRSLPCRICRRVWHMPTALWTLTGEDTFADCTGEHAIPIFEGFEP